MNERGASVRPLIAVYLQPAIITIDGPAASGKSTIGLAVAAALDYLFFDTGIMYRAVTWAALERGTDLRSEADVASLAEAIVIDVKPPAVPERDGRQVTVLVDGEDATWGIRTPEVDQNVSLVSAYAGVRQALSRQQRRIGRRFGGGQAEKAGIVMVGRDIGTVILPEAPLKIYMDASPEERARRRTLDLEVRGEKVVYAEVLADLIRRDQLDSERSHSPLRAAPDAVVVDTSDLTPAAVVETILEAAMRRSDSAPPRHRVNAEDAEKS